MKYQALLIFTLLLFTVLPSSAFACLYDWEQGDEPAYDDVYVGKLVDYSRSERKNEYSNIEVTEVFTISTIKAYYGDKAPGSETIVKKFSRGSGDSCDVAPVFNDNNAYDPEAEYYLAVNIYGGSDTMSGDGPRDTTIYMFAKNQSELEESIDKYDESYAGQYDFELGIPEVTITEEESGEPSTETDNSYFLQQIKQIMETIATLRSLILGRS